MLKFKWNLVHFLARLHYHQQVRLRNQQCIERNLKRHWNQWFYLVHRLQNQMRRNFLEIPRIVINWEDMDLLMEQLPRGQRHRAERIRGVSLFAEQSLRESCSCTWWLCIRISRIWIMIFLLGGVAKNNMSTKCSVTLWLMEGVKIAGVAFVKNGSFTVTMGTQETMVIIDARMVHVQILPSWHSPKIWGGTSNISEFHVCSIHVQMQLHEPRSVTCRHGQIFVHEPVTSGSTGSTEQVLHAHCGCRTGCITFSHMQMWYLCFAFSALILACKLLTVTNKSKLLTVTNNKTQTSTDLPYIFFVLGRCFRQSPSRRWNETLIGSEVGNLL